MQPIGIDLWAVIKIMFLVGMLLYLVFGYIVIRQAGHMTKTLQVGFETPIRFFAWVHFFASVFLFALALVFL